LQIEKLDKDITEQQKKRVALEARAGNANKNVQELNTKLEKVTVRLWLRTYLLWYIRLLFFLYFAEKLQLLFH
jgi:hypothetical protein